MLDSICVVGLGLMGRPMARTLIHDGHRVRGWNRSTLADELIQGIPLCADLGQASQTDVLLLVLSDSAAVDQVLEQLLPHLSGGQLVVDMGTSDPTRSRIHAEALEAMSVEWLDAPVSGGPGGAEAGNLAIMAGGSVVAFERAKPILESLGSNVVHVGGAGTGHVTKLINQLIVGLTIQAVSEGLTLAEKAGLDLKLVQEALKGGFADSKILQLHGTRMIERAYVPGGKVTTQLKDLRLCKKLAGSVELTLPHLESTLGFYEALVARDEGDLDHSALHALLWTT
jgi:3-hydroxyisobutyrate dehydrogenase-like beta-hydroxyacid dehydrogenase